MAITTFQIGFSTNDKAPPGVADLSPMRIYVPIPIRAPIVARMSI